METLGITSIAAIPDGFSLTGKQAVIRNVTISGMPYVSPDLEMLLRESGPPACYLDFEAMMPPVPPLRRVPARIRFCRSNGRCHSLTSNDPLTHSAFLADGRGDPRRDFAVSLINALSDKRWPDCRLLRLRGGTSCGCSQLSCQSLLKPLRVIMVRLVDLLPIVRDAVYFPEFCFSNSIKAVAPCPSARLRLWRFG